jgi:hypothetical protein
MLSLNQRLPTDAEPMSASEMLCVKQSDGNGENGEGECTCLHLDERHEVLQRLEAVVGVAVLLGGSCGGGAGR